MPITKDELAQKNFGYLTGSDLMQFAPFELLSSQYNKFPSLIQTGCTQAYAEMLGELSSVYDVQKELSNSNQRIEKQTGLVAVNIAAGSYISRITLKPKSISSIKIGTTTTGSEIFELVDLLLEDKTIWINKSFSSATTLYFQITGTISFDIICQGGVPSPPILIKEYQNQSTAFTLFAPADTFIYQMLADIVLSTPSVSIGTSFGATDILPLTLVNGSPLNLIQQYFAVDSILFVTVVGGSVNIRFDIGYNYTLPSPTLNTLREQLFAQITAVIAIRNILGSISGENTMLKSHFEWAYDKIKRIKQRQMGLQLSSPPTPMEARATMVYDSFRMKG